MSSPLEVVVVILRSHRCVWMAERRAVDKPYFGMLHAPGGKVESGELKLEAAAREVLEETGLKLDLDRFYEGRSSMHRTDDGEPFVVTWFVVSLEADEIPQRTEPEKTGEWYPISIFFAQHLSLNMTPGTIAAINDAFHRPPKDAAAVVKKAAERLEALEVYRPAVVEQLEKLRDSLLLKNPTVEKLYDIAIKSVKGAR